MSKTFKKYLILAEMEDDKSWQIVDGQDSIEDCVPLLYGDYFEGATHTTPVIAKVVNWKAVESSPTPQSNKKEE